MYLLDSSAIIEILSGTEKGRKVKGSLEGKLVTSTSFSLHEVLVGTKNKDEEITKKLFDEIPLFNFTRESAKESIDIEKELIKKGRMIGRTDIFIAGICKEQNATLVTCDSDFKNIKNIQIVFID